MNSKNSFGEICRVFTCTLKRLQLSRLCIAVFFCCGLSVLCYKNFLMEANGTEEFFEIFFSPHAGNLIHTLLYFSPLGILLICSFDFLTKGICDEYYYTRIKNKLSLIIAKMACLALATAMIIMIELLVYALAGRILAPSISIGAFDILIAFCKLLVARVTLLAIMLLLIFFFTKYLVLIVMIILVLMGAYIKLPAPVFFWINTLNIQNMDALALTEELVLLAIIILAVLRVELKRDIIQGDSKNG